jgi:diguanylate cyclase (GGDEF)-like protein
MSSLSLPVIAVIIISLVSMMWVAGILIYNTFFRKSNLAVSMQDKEKLKVLQESCTLSEDAIFVINRTHEIVHINPAATKMASVQLNGSVVQLRNSLQFKLKDTDRWIPMESLIQKHRMKKGSKKSIFRDVEIGGEHSMFASITIVTLKCEHNHQMYDIISIHDNSFEKKLYSLHHLSPMTGLSNRHKAFGDITALTATASKRDRFAVIMVELDDASNLRSLLGYAEMDKIISAISHVLRDKAKNNKYIMVYHMHYVTFMIIYKAPSSPEVIYNFLKEFRQDVQKAYSLKEKKRTLNLSAGISLFPNNGTLYGLVNSAYSALAKAQDAGHGHTVMAEKNYEQKVDQELALINEIEKAIEKKDLKLYFQPLYRSKDFQIAGAEVLLRWIHPERGFIPPDTFIPIAEKSGLILDIGKYVLEETLRHLHTWKSFGFPPIILNINMSLRELEDDNFIVNLQNSLNKYDIGKSGIKMEITEHASMLNPTLTHQRLNNIRQLGIEIALDDFGTGYSSFAYLAEFPIGTLKIDKGFVRGFLDNPSHKHIVETIAKLGHSLGMTIVAEGVEELREALALRKMGVDYLQGYYFSKPIPQLEFQYLLSHPKKFTRE